MKTFDEFVNYFEKLTRTLFDNGTKSNYLPRFRTNSKVNAEILPV